MTTTRETADQPLNELLAKAVEHVKSMTPEERAAMFEAQKKAWIAAEMSIGDEGTRVVSGHRATADHIGEANEKVDHIGDVTTMIDHAELARLADDVRAPMSTKTMAMHQDAIARMMDYVTPIRILALLSEIAALRTAGEIIAQKAENAIQQGFAHIERATQAERQRDEAVGLLRLFDDHLGEDEAMWTDDSTVTGEWIGSDGIRHSLTFGMFRRVRAFLANQGADQ